MKANTLFPGIFRVKKLNKQTHLHGLEKFHCSLDDTFGLDDFIHKEAFDYQQKDMGTTYLFYNDTDEIVGYVTVAMGSIKKKNVSLPDDDCDAKEHFPALWLGRLAVYNEQRGAGIGTYLLEWCFGFAEKESRHIGCRFIVLVTKGERRTKFYVDRSFKVSTVKLSEGKKLLFFDLHGRKDL